jgi:diketogulonate reductase-like aldo/keto reductase
VRDENGKPNPDKRMERLQQERLVKHIGVSNFKKDQIGNLLQAGLSKPVVDQVELHPYLQQPELVQ